MGSLVRKSRLVSGCVVLSYVFLLPRTGLTQESATDTLRRQVTEMQEQLKKALERIDQLEKEKSATSGKIDQLESAAALTTALPWNLTAKGGRFFADFGRLPKYHQDALPFVNFPLAIERMIGGESQADGAELYYLFPTPFFLRATLGGMNKIGA